jgi:hypothetical protein
VETVNTTEGLFYLKLYYILKEHVTVFSDRTVFNDIIYDKTTGYRQERIKTQGYRTVDWDGDYTSPGFLFDNVNIAVWQPFTDYRLGDIVAYKSYNWTSLQNQLGTEVFDDSKWSKLDTTPTKKLISNFDYKVKEFSDFYEVSSEGIGQSQRDLARHTIGYQTRDYLQNLSEDSATQFQLYQGFIREKGTANAITKVFGKLSRSGADSIILNEEWAFRVGRFGGTDQLSEVEIQLIKNKFILNPQPLLIENLEPSIIIDQYYRLLSNDFTISLLPFVTDINPVSLEVIPTNVAGYVKTDQIEHIVNTRDGILDLDINAVNENHHIWITFDRLSWNVLRLNESSQLAIVSVERTAPTTVVIALNRNHKLSINTIIGIRDVINLVGFFKIVETTTFTITIEVASDSQDPETDASTIANIHLLTEARFNSYEDIDPRHGAFLKNNSKIFGARRFTKGNLKYGLKRTNRIIFTKIKERIKEISDNNPK